MNVAKILGGLITVPEMKEGANILLNQHNVLVKIEKLNYTHSDGNAAAKRASINIGEWNHVKIEVNGSTLKTTVSSSSGESVTLEFTDDFALSGGRFGFYTSGASASYKNLKISG